jgi:hypothetical protein
MLRMLPALPMLRILPALPILRILPVLPILRMLPELKRLRMLKALRTLRMLAKLSTLLRLATLWNEACCVGIEASLHVSHYAIYYTLLSVVQVGNGNIGHVILSAAKNPYPAHERF